MKYMGMPMGMWLVFSRSFQRNLVDVFGLDKDEAEKLTKKAKPRYQEIIAKLPEFEKKDRFKMNIVNCAMLSAFLLNVKEAGKLPPVEKVTEYYKNAMMIPAMQWFCRKSGKKKYSDSDIKSMRETAKLRAGDRNPYSWNMEFYEYADGSGYEARFTACGICTLMTELGLQNEIPAMCRLDYTMSEAGGVTNFVREYTLASGGTYCDCGYKKKQ